MKYRYVIQWCYKGEHDVRITYVECSRRSVRSAIKQFRAQFNTFLHPHFNLDYVVLSAFLLGCVIKNCR